VYHIKTPALSGKESSEKGKMAYLQRKANSPPVPLSKRGEEYAYIQFRRERGKMVSGSFLPYTPNYGFSPFF
jgi:hypothetical protein